MVPEPFFDLEGPFRITVDYREDFLVTCDRALLNRSEEITRRQFPVRFTGIANEEVDAFRVGMEVDMDATDIDRELSMRGLIMADIDELIEFSRHEGGALPVVTVHNGRLVGVEYPDVVGRIYSITGMVHAPFYALGIRTVPNIPK